MFLCNDIWCDHDVLTDFYLLRWLIFFVWFIDENDFQYEHLYFMKVFTSILISILFNLDSAVILANTENDLHTWIQNEFPTCKIDW